MLCELKTKPWNLTFFLFGRSELPDGRFLLKPSSVTPLLHQLLRLFIEINSSDSKECNVPNTILPSSAFLHEMGFLMSASDQINYLPKLYYGIIRPTMFTKNLKRTPLFLTNGAMEKYQFSATLFT